MAGQPKSFKFEKPDIVPFLIMRTSEDGPRVFVGYRDSERPSDYHSGGDHQTALTDELKVRTYHFDQTTLEHSSIAQALEGVESDPFLVLRALESFIDGHENHEFTEEDRTVIKALQDALEKRGFDISSDRMAGIEKISRQAGNAPNPDYPQVTKEQELDELLQSFYETLTPEQQELYIDPRLVGMNRPHPDFGDGTMVGYYHDPLSGVEEQKTFLDSLSPAQREQYQTMLKEHGLDTPGLPVLGRLSDDQIKQFQTMLGEHALDTPDLDKLKVHENGRSPFNLDQQNIIPPVSEIAIQGKGTPSMEFDGDGNNTLRIGDTPASDAYGLFATADGSVLAEKPSADAGVTLGDDLKNKAGETNYDFSEAKM